MLLKRADYHLFPHYVAVEEKIEAGGDSGHCVTYGIAYHLGSGTGGDFVIGVRYRDDVVRADGRWVISGRVVEGIWRQPLGSEVTELSA